jgi:hypothetical protein
LKHLIYLICFIFFLIISACNESPVAPEQSGNAFYSSLEYTISSDDSSSTVNINKWKEISGPCIITEPGVYTLITDFQTGTSGNGIEILGVNHVYLDLNGHKISGSSGHYHTKGVWIDSCEWILVDNGFIEGYTAAVTFETSSKCTMKDITVTSGYLKNSPPPPHYWGAEIINSDRVKIAWNLFDHIEYGVDVFGHGSALNKIINNIFNGGTYSPGKSGISYSILEDSPTDDIIKNNIFSNFYRGFNLETYEGYNKFINNTVNYLISPYINNDSTNVFRNNTFTLITP